MAVGQRPRSIRKPTAALHSTQQATRSGERSAPAEAATLRKPLPRLHTAPSLCPPTPPSPPTSHTQHCCAAFHPPTAERPHDRTLQKLRPNGLGATCLEDDTAAQHRGKPPHVSSKQRLETLQAPALVCTNLPRNVMAAGPTRPYNSRDRGTNSQTNVPLQSYLLHLSCLPKAAVDPSISTDASA